MSVKEKVLSSGATGKRAHQLVSEAAKNLPMAQLVEFGDVKNVQRVERQRADVSVAKPVLPPMPKGRVVTPMKF